MREQEQAPCYERSYERNRGSPVLVGGRLEESGAPSCPGLQTRPCTQERAVTNAAAGPGLTHAPASAGGGIGLPVVGRLGARALRGKDRNDRAHHVILDGKHVLERAVVVLCPAMRPVVASISWAETRTRSPPRRVRKHRCWSWCLLRACPTSRRDPAKRGRCARGGQYS